MKSKTISQLQAKADDLVDIGDLVHAESLYREILSYDNKNTDAHYMLGVIFAEKGDLASATDFLNKAIEINSQYPDPYFILAKIQQSKEEYKSAFDNCLKATSLDPEFDEAWLLLCSLSIWLKDNNQAIKSCQQAINYFPDSIKTYSNLAAALFNKCDYSQSTEYYKKVILLEPDNIPAHKFLCLSLLRDKEFKQALEIVQKMLDIDFNNAESYNYLCEAYLGLNEIDNAENACKKSLEIVPSNITAYINMGNIFQQRFQYKTSIIWYKKALEIEPDNANLHYNLGISYFRLNNNDNAATSFHKAMEINPDLSASKHMLAIVEGKNLARVDAIYLTDLFDEYAHRYNKHQQDLKYHVPEYINDTIRDLYYSNHLNCKLDILDLGCGTGLCAPYLADITKSITGVDLSPDMIKQAKKLSLYNELIVGDMNEYMNSRPDMFDIAIAADVFIYMGDLNQEFHAAKVTLKDNALLIFNIQLNDDIASYELTDTGRYNHADSYISSLIDTYGFIHITSNNVISRYDLGIPVDSRIYVLQNSRI